MAVIDVSDNKKRTVGHLPIEIAKICCHFLHYGGTITGVVTGSNEELKKDCGGLEIPSKIVLSHSRLSTVQKAKQLVQTNYCYIN